MRILLRFALVALMVTGPWAAPRPAAAANLDTTADYVFGQPDFTSGIVNNGGLSASSLAGPGGVAWDIQGNLYVADTYNHRVLEYDAPLSSDMVADRVFGQPTFITNTVNNGGLSASSLNLPYSVALDAQGNLYVADALNNRVLEYDAPLTTDTIADRVFGQPDFTSNTANNGGLSASSLDRPFGVALDAQGNLYVADFLNNRVLEYDNPLTGDHNADRVFGQPNFTSNTANNGGLSASSLNRPYDVALDTQGNLYVADAFNNRVLEYGAPLITHLAASRVFGQPDFTSGTVNNGGRSATSLEHPNGVALDAQGNLYISDEYNNRVLQYNTPLTADTTADRVFGQSGSFTSSTPNNGGLSASSFYQPSGVAITAQGNLSVADWLNDRVLGYDVPVAHAAPTLASIGPSSVAAGSPELKLTVNGANFVGGSVVRLNGSPRPTAYVNSTRLIATLSAADVAAGGPFAVTVFTPAPGGGTTALTNLPLYARAGHDPVADVVQGQPNFVSNTQNNPVLTGAQRLIFPKGVAVDPHSGRLYVADQANHRVLGWPNAPAFANGQPADLVLGQPNLDTGTANAGGLSANSLSSPTAVALDALGNLYVADSNNHRVLVYEAPLSSGMAASRVFGQGGSFTTALANNGGLGANSLSFPAGVALDAAGNLYVADSNHRVLQYDTPLTGDTTADRVFGQPNFTTNTANNGGLSAASLNGPQGVAMDQLGRLYVADQFNNRVLAYDNPLSTDRIADQVFGQPDFASGAVNNGGVSADSQFFPFGVALDVFGTLYVADTFNSRVLAYDRPLTTDTTADRVIGQPNFTSDTFNNGGLSATSLFQPFSVALDRRGSLFVSDSGNNRLLVYEPQLFSLMLPLIGR